MPFSVELQVCAIILIAIFALMGMVVYSINSEMEFERDCFQRDGVMRRTNDGPICIKKDAVLK